MKIAALVEVAACLLGGLALAESPVAPTTPCPAGNEVTQRHLLGLWRATFDGLTQGAGVRPIVSKPARRGAARDPTGL